jgi:hypothetical protein
MEDELIALERAGWTALATDADTATRFYEDVLAAEVVFLLPGGMVIDDRSDVIDSMRGAAWDRFDLEEERVWRFSDDCAAVTYQATAARGGDEYRALCNSTYVRSSGRWLLALHQQTPALGDSRLEPDHSEQNSR